MSTAALLAVFELNSDHPMSEPSPEVGQAAGFPPDSELVFGLVGAVGVDLGAVARGLIAELARFRYRGVDIHLTDAFDAFDFSETLVDDPYDERLWSYMSAGDELRERWRRHDAMALLAINRIALERSVLTGNESLPSDRAAYVLRSFKRPEEIKLLREIYGSRFLLVGVAATEVLRLDYLQRRIAPDAPSSTSACARASSTGADRARPARGARRSRTRRPRHVSPC
jgi:hypothetical protein